MLDVTDGSSIGKKRSHTIFLLIVGLVNLAVQDHNNSIVDLNGRLGTVMNKMILSLRVNCKQRDGLPRHGRLLLGLMTC